MVMKMNIYDIKNFFSDSTFYSDLIKGNTYNVISNIKNYFIDNGISSKIIGKNVIIHETAVIESPVIIHDNVEISPHAYIRAYSIIGENVKIGHASEVKNAIIFPNAKLASFTFVGDAIIGLAARVGSGVITANRRFDQGVIGLKDDLKYTSFGLEFMGVILGDYSRLGASVTTLPGTHICPHTWIMPNNRVKGYIPRNIIFDNEIMKSKEEIILK